MPRIFADNPTEYFNADSGAAHRLPHTELNDFQLVAIQTRFAAMRDALAPLQALAGQQDISAIEFWSRSRA